MCCRWRLPRRMRDARFAPAQLTCGVVTRVRAGAAIGTAASMLYDGAYCGGRALDDYVGIRAERSERPTSRPAPGFGRLWSLAFTAAFFAFGGDRVALAGVRRNASRASAGVARAIARALRPSP